MRPLGLLSARHAHDFAVLNPRLTLHCNLAALGTGDGVEIMRATRAETGLPDRLDDKQVICRSVHDEIRQRLHSGVIYPAAGLSDLTSYFSRFWRSRFLDWVRILFFLMIWRMYP